MPSVSELTLLQDIFASADKLETFKKQVCRCTTIIRTARDGMIPLMALSSSKVVAKDEPLAQLESEPLRGLFELLSGNNDALPAVGTLKLLTAHRLVKCMRFVLTSHCKPGEFLGALRLARNDVEGVMTSAVEAHADGYAWLAKVCTVYFQHFRNHIPNDLVAKYMTVIVRNCLGPSPQISKYMIFKFVWNTLGGLVKPQADATPIGAPAPQASGGAPE